MKFFKMTAKELFTLLAALTIVLGCTPQKQDAAPPVQEASAPVVEEVVANKANLQNGPLLIQLPPLEQFVDYVFDECASRKMSPAMREVNKKRLLRYVNDGRLKGLEKYDYIAIPCIETGMGSIKHAVSSAGALGFAQLMPATARMEAKIMGIGEFVDSDLQDPDLNLDISVNHYARLISLVGPELAAAAYNAGSASTAVKELDAMRPIKNSETAGYVSVAYVIIRKQMREANDQIKELAKPKATASNP